MPSQLPPTQAHHHSRYLYKVVSRDTKSPSHTQMALVLDDEKRMWLTQPQSRCEAATRASIMHHMPLCSQWMHSLSLAVILSLLTLLVSSAILCKQEPRTFTRSNTVISFRGEGSLAVDMISWHSCVTPWHAPSVSQTPYHS
jgi:hypothetical protein